jgi:hypothetical protein
MGPIPLPESTDHAWYIQLGANPERRPSLRAFARGHSSPVEGIIDPLIEELLDQNPEDFGYNSTIWTASLLAHYLLEECGIEVFMR